MNLDRPKTTLYYIQPEKPVISLQTMLLSRLNSYGSNIAWPPRSLHLQLWMCSMGLLKDKYYKVAAFKIVVARITSEILVCVNSLEIKIAKYYRDIKGDPLYNMIFKT